MSFIKREVELKDLKGNKVIFEGIYEKKKSTSLDAPSSEYENLVAVMINGEVVRIEGLGHFYHPDTGEAYTL
ncbi:hypothetical protein [Acinetobacter indicus]|uniref:hypothetical protein n=1 Tax=Acinetobacter indicus TaxID=756892 RepID=UPI001443B316|nr:hypothetical protein [Acinetobacter indicus]